ncbi:MAG: acylphosphatase [Hyphomicrobiales bacterium]|nr:acylphosphatase [Hyphomicrobiales bacterium]
MTGARTVHIRIEGRVQGVGYRAWTQSAALDLGLAGWVRNRRDGAVEAVIQGEPDKVAEMLRKCRTGPLGASVTRVEIIGEGVGAFDRFEVRRTA